MKSYDLRLGSLAAWASITVLSNKVNGCFLLLAKYYGHYPKHREVRLMKWLG